MRPLFLAFIHLLNHKRTFSLTPWQLYFLKNLWEENLLKALKNPSIFLQPDHHYLHTHWFLKNTKIFVMHGFSLQSLVLSYFVIFIPLPPNSIPYYSFCPSHPEVLPACSFLGSPSLKPLKKPAHQLQTLLPLCWGWCKPQIYIPPLTAEQFRIWFPLELVSEAHLLLAICYYSSYWFIPRPLLQAVQFEAVLLPFPP